jgi:DNA polymerase III delta subunit
MRAAARRLDDQTMNHVFQKLALIDQQSKGMANGNPWHSLDRLVCMMCAA